MKSIIKIMLTCTMLLGSAAAWGQQDSTAAPIDSMVHWEQYAEDTSLTYNQITDICDSLFALVMKPADSAEADTTQLASAKEADDNTPYFNYCRWKQFWGPRIDVNTGKIFGMKNILALKTTSGGSTFNDCGETSPFQSSLGYFMPGENVGWHWVGPENIQNVPLPNTLQEALGRVTQIMVNPGDKTEVYIASSWGGLWKTNNAQDAVPKWICLTDNDHKLAGIGIAKFDIAWGSGGAPNKIFLIIGYPEWGQYFANKENTVGIYYSQDDGLTYGKVLETSVDLSNPSEFINDLKLWQPNSTTPPQFVFFTSHFKVSRINLLTMTGSATSGYIPGPDGESVMIDMHTGIDNYLSPLFLVWTDNWRFLKGFGEMAFRPSDPTYMYVASNSNTGNGYPLGARLYEIPNSTTCTTCTPTDITCNIPNASHDVVAYGAGSFNVTTNVSTFAVPNPTAGMFINLGTLPTVNWQWRNAAALPPMATLFPDAHMEITKATSTATSEASAASIEVAVDGGYIQPDITYGISFKAKIPVGGNIKVILRDALGTSGTPTDYAGPLPNDIVVATLSSTSATMPFYNNFTVHLPLPPGTASGHYVDRLIIAAWFSSSAASTATIYFDSMEVKQCYFDAISNLRTLRGSPAPDDIYMTTSRYYGQTHEVVRLNTTGLLTSPATVDMDISPDITPGLCILALSPNSADKVYLGNVQSPLPSWGIGSGDLSLGTSSIGPLTGQGANHTDVRSLAVYDSAVLGGDLVFEGNDGGISLFKQASLSWNSMNGKGFHCSLPWSIGSSEHTGDISMGTGDNSILSSNEQTFSTWTLNNSGDAGDTKYGKRYATRNAYLNAGNYTGGGGGSGAIELNPIPTPVGLPIIAASGAMTIQGEPLSVIKTTDYGEYFGQSLSAGTLSGHGQIYRVDPGSASPFTCLTCTTGPSGAPELQYPKVQAVAPDMVHADYMMAWNHVRQGDGGELVWTSGATAGLAASSPTWHHIPTPTINGGSISDFRYLSTICSDPRTFGSTKRLWAGCSGYNYGGPLASLHSRCRVFQSVDNGTSWTDITYNTGNHNGLPPGPINALVYDERSRYLFAGTDFGVYALKPDLLSLHPDYTWECYSLNLPNSFVTGLDVNRCTGKLYVSMLGRGAYEADLPPAWNWNGTDWPGIHDSCNIDYITAAASPVIWTQDVDEMRTIYIEPGATLIIQNCTVNMARNRNIIVDHGTAAADGSITQSGGTLILQGATITNTCGAMWGCINILGDPTAVQTVNTVTASLPFSNQGLVVTDNYTVGGVTRKTIIENAYTGVWAGGQYYDGLDFPDYQEGYGGGVLRAKNTIFHNCHTGVAFFPYKYTEKSYIQLSNFLADDTLHSFHYKDYTAGPTSPRNFGAIVGIYNNGTTGLVVYTDTFETLDNTVAPFNFHPDYDLRGVGYSGYNDQLKIGNCIFNNLTRGVFKHNTLTIGLSSLSQSTFTNCWRAVSLCNVDNILCQKNNIVNGPWVHYATDVTWSTLNIVALGTPYGENYKKNPFGIFCGQTSLFNIADNTITGTSSGFWDMGIIINNSNHTGGTMTSNELYKNHMLGTSFGVVPLQDNRGLFIQCNELRTGLIGIFEDHVTGAISRLGQQGDCSSPARNTFYPTPLFGTIPTIWPSYLAVAGGNEAGDFKYFSESIAPYFPLHVSAGPLFVPFTTSAVAMPVPTGCNNVVHCPAYETCCPDVALYRVKDASGSNTTLGSGNIWFFQHSGLGDSAGNFDDSLLYTDIALQDALSSIRRADLTIASDNAMVDGGNTPGLLALIYNPGTADADVLAALGAVGGYLSDGVLTAAIDRVPMLDPSAMKTIVIANSGLTTDVFNELSLMDTLLANDTDVINAQNNESARSQMEATVRELDMKRNDYLKAVIRYYNSIEDWPSAGKLFLSEGYYEQAFECYIKAEDYGSAQSMIDNISGVGSNTTIGNTGYADRDLAALMTIHLNHVSQGLSLDSLSSDDSTTLYTILTQPATHAGELARIWYCHAYNIPFYELMPSDTRGADSTQQRRRTQTTTDVNKPNVTMFPNPANDMVTIRISNSKWLPGSTISGMDMYGRRLFTVAPSSDNTDVKVNTQGWTSGIYIFTVQLGDGSIFTSKIVVNK